MSESGPRAVANLGGWRLICAQEKPLSPHMYLSYKTMTKVSLDV